MPQSNGPSPPFPIKQPDREKGPRKLRYCLVNRFVDVPIPEELDEHDVADLKSYFQTLYDDDEDFADAIDCELNTPDDRATLEKVQILDVAIAENGMDVEIEYAVCYYANHQCRDQSYNDEIHRSTKGIRQGEYWRFPKPPISPDRSTFVCWLKPRRLSKDISFFW